MAELLVFIGSYPVWPGFAVLAAVTIAVTAGYMLWMIQRVLHGPLPARWTTLSDATPLQTFAVGALMLAIVLLGIYPSLLVDVVATGIAPMARLLVQP